MAVMCLGHLAYGTCTRDTLRASAEAGADDRQRLGPNRNRKSPRTPPGLPHNGSTMVKGPRPTLRRSTGEHRSECALNPGIRHAFEISLKIPQHYASEAPSPAKYGHTAARFAPEKARPVPVRARWRRNVMEELADDPSSNAPRSMALSPVPSSRVPSTPSSPTMDAFKQGPRRSSTFTIEEFSDLCSSALDLGTIPEPHLSFLANLPLSEENINIDNCDSPSSPTVSSEFYSLEDVDAEPDDVDMGDFTCAANSSEDVLGTKFRQRERMQQRDRTVTQDTVTAQSVSAAPYATSECLHGGSSLAPSSKGNFFKNLKTRASALMLSKISSSHSQQAQPSVALANSESPPSVYSQPSPPPSSPRSPTRPPPSSFHRPRERTISNGPKSFLDINDDAEDQTSHPRPSFSSSIFRRPLTGRPATPIPSSSSTATHTAANSLNTTPGRKVSPESGYYSFPDTHSYHRSVTGTIPTISHSAASSPNRSSPRRTTHPNGLRGLFTSKSTNFPRPSKPLDPADYAAPLLRLNSDSSGVSTYTAPRPAPKPAPSSYVDPYGRRPSAPEDYAYARAKEKEAMKALPPVPTRSRVNSQASYLHPLAVASYKSKSRSRSKLTAALPGALHIQIPRARTKSNKSTKAMNVRNANASSSTGSSGPSTPVVDIRRQESGLPFFHLTVAGTASVPPVPPLPSPGLTKVMELEKKKRSRTRSASVTSQISDVLSAGLAGLGVGTRARSKSKESVMPTSEESAKGEEKTKEEALNVGRVLTPEDDPFKKGNIVEVRGKKGSGYSTLSGSGSEEDGKWVVPPRMRGLGLDMSAVMGQQPHPYASVAHRQTVSPVSPATLSPLWGAATPPMHPPPTCPLPEVPHLPGLPTPPSSSTLPPLSAFGAEGRERAFVYPPPVALGPLPPPPSVDQRALLPTPPMTDAISGRRQSFIDMDGAEGKVEAPVRKVRHVPTLEEVRDRTRTRSGSPFPLPLGPAASAGTFGDCEREEEDVVVEEGQSRIVFTNPWANGAQTGEGEVSLSQGSERDSAVDVECEWPLPPRRVVRVLVDEEDGGKEGVIGGGWHEVEQGVEFFPRKSSPDPTTPGQQDIGCRHLIMFPKKGSLISEASTATSFTHGSNGTGFTHGSIATSYTDGSNPGCGGTAADALVVAPAMVRRGSQRIVVVTDGDTRGWSSHGRGGDDKSPLASVSPTTRQLSGQQARAIVEKFGGRMASEKDEQPRRSEDSSCSAYHSARSSCTGSLPGSPVKRRPATEKVVRIADARFLDHEETTALFGQRAMRLRLVAAAGWRELMGFCEAFAEVRVGAKVGQSLFVSLVEEQAGMSMVLEVSPARSFPSPVSPASPKMPGHWRLSNPTLRHEELVVSTFHLPCPTTLGEIGRSCRRGFVGEGVESDF
ncbi:hypothetical protein GLOTRDRAFT_119132 [Gloeophyllum trabeum ATCC 11539]|uniref:Uncharacterized protein n=1 Tax=Gloeophyllum trabeum (strain ATCC 11539 / FP-39264 / Madison 617) TaxID=670483 RepID=S7S1B3_GLOTA|nr:uncharacterized protein GLOTRDRAFT_119132 [Gloeophyllum trabeum ATCC 11539]EPQ61230.1 hypothetical protein GLOTRDRAFT_119132 [Gloeophyllum trabeum ATCC 11539]